MATQQDFDTIWGSTGAVTEPSVTIQNKGWIAEIPPHQTQNWWQNRVDLQLEYMQERGLALYNAAFTYQQGSIVVYDTGFGELSPFKIYISLQDANTGNTPALGGSAWWLEYGTTSVAPRGYIDGLRVSHSTGNPTNDVDIAAGECAMYPDGALPGETQMRFRITAATLNKAFNETWTSGTGLRVGTLAVGTWWRLFAIGFVSTGLVNFGADTAANARAQGLEVVASHSHYRQIAWVRSDDVASATIVPFYQHPDDLGYVRWVSPSQSQAATSISSSASSITALAPPDSVADILYRTLGNNNSNSSHYGIISPLASADIAPSSTVHNVSLDRDSAGFGNNYAERREMIALNGSSQFRHRWDASTANATTRVQTVGYRYNRGRA